MTILILESGPNPAQALAQALLRGGRGHRGAVRWTRLSCREFRNHEVRLQLHALAYILANFMRTLALPDIVEQWSLTTLKRRLSRPVPAQAGMSDKIVCHGQCHIPDG